MSFRKIIAEKVMAEVVFWLPPYIIKPGIFFFAVPVLDCPEARVVDAAL